MRKLLAVLILAALPMAAQDQKKEEPKEALVQKLFVLKYADPNQVNNLIHVFTNNTTPNSAMHAIAVSATPEAMAAIEDAIKRLDVPSSTPQNFEVMAYLLIGAEADGATPAALPKELDSVVAQLKSAFSFKAYRLSNVLTVRGRAGQRLSTEDSGDAVVIGDVAQPIFTQFRINSLSLGADGAIHVDGLGLSSSVPMGQGSQFMRRDVAINTDLDVKEGQKVVVGKIGINAKEAMFLVLVARVMQ